MNKYFLSGVIASGATALFLAGCSTTVEPEIDKNSGKQPLYKHLERANIIAKNDQIECLELFNPNKDDIAVKHHIIHLNMKPGASIKPRVSADAEILYVTHGSGMVKVNGVAYVLRVNSGLYIPKSSNVTMLNNSKKPLKLMVVTKNLSDIQRQSPKKPLAFDKNTPKQGESKSYKEIISSEPLKIDSKTIKPETLSPGESKIKTLGQEGFK